MSFGRSTWNRLCRAGTLCLILPAFVGGLSAQQQQQGVCASVKIEIIQELTLERIGFEATLEITNNDGEDPITDFFADLTFENPLLSTNGEPHDAAELFFVRAPELEGIQTVDGAGVIGPTKTIVSRWFIIPKISAGGMTPDGIRYRVGARLSGKFQGQELSPEILQVFADTIVVKPEPQLEITYFQPRDVQGDDPFTTDIVESPIPFTLGVLVKNSGYGIARKMKISSQQPRIVENRRNLLLVAQLLGARVMDSPRAEANLVLDLGNIEPGQTRKGAWDMITSLSGEFVEFKASYTHASELGGEETSVIASLEAHFIAHEVLNDQPGRDDIKDFLADTDRDENQIPDALYESEGNILPVNHLPNATVDGGGTTFQVNLVADRAGWGYMRLTDPGQARRRIAGVVRSDGKNLNTNNAWTNIRYEKVTNNKLTYLNILDLVDLGEYQYTVTYAPALMDTNPPVTTLRFVGDATEAGNRFYITPETQMYFLSEDESPVGIVYRIGEDPFIPALPFRLTEPGEYPIAYYATDSSGNQEEEQEAILVVSFDPPSLVGVSIAQGPIFSAGDAFSIRPDSADFTFQVNPNPTTVDARIDVFRGVVAWATVGGVPSSPTASTSASLEVGGDHVDFYRYRLDGGSWSAERAVTQLIELSSLASGTRTVEVLGRSQHGTYLPDSTAVSVSWNVNPSAPPTVVTGTPATPTRRSDALLQVAGSGVTHYRWTLNEDFYRAETAIANPIALSNLVATAHVVSVIGRTNGVYQPTNNATRVAWTVNPLYGFDLSSLSRVRSVSYTNVGAAPITFDWDGRNDGGIVMPPGWYTVRLTLIDALHRTNFSTRLIEIGDLAAATQVLADESRGARNPHGSGRWAVWQDQANGNWRIFGQDLSVNNSSAGALSPSSLAQLNPRTDGRHAAWQERRTDGNWDVVVHRLPNDGQPGSASGSTTTSGIDETKPAIDWPWVVYQTRATGNTNAPWLLEAWNLVTDQKMAVSAATQDQLDPAVHAGRVVWQDFRDVGFGEIYFKDLESGDERRLHTNAFSQLHPAIQDNWVVWQDNRNGTVDIYGYDLIRNAEFRLTPTAENEARPFIDGDWLVCEEDSLGSQTANIKIIHLPTLRSIPLTRGETTKTRPAFAGGRIFWQDGAGSSTRIVSTIPPTLQGVFENRNAVAVTDAMETHLQDAHTLLALWHSQAGVQEITRYASLVPEVVSETASWNNGTPQGPNFPLNAGGFLWVRFDDRRVLDLGANLAGTLTFAPGVNAFSYTEFPGRFSAYTMIRQIGLANVRGIRMLDPRSGRWRVAESRDGGMVGEDFPIPSVAVLMIDMIHPVMDWRPQ